MRRLIGALGLGLIIFSSALRAQNNNSMDTVSYSLGVLMAQNLKKQGLQEVDPAALVKGMQDVLQDNKLQVSLAEANQIVQSFMQAQQSKKYEGVIAEGEAFLTKNAAKEGVKQTESGLQYEILTEGSGPKPKPTDRVTVHYEGKLLDGTVFDSSVERGQPATFGVTQVIQGWVEALQLMPTGSKWRLFIPYNLAYGERGAGEQIGPYETLIFEVELISIN